MFACALYPKSVEFLENVRNDSITGELGLQIY